MKLAQVSNRPKRRRSSGPLTVVVPPVPMTCARTIRAGTPCLTTLIRRKRPSTNPRSLLWARLSVKGQGPHSRRGHSGSNGSLTLMR